MKKLAYNEYPIHELLEGRWSPRAFSNSPVEKNKLLSVLEAARWAPSSYNEQPWNFIVARKETQEGYNKLLECLLEGNRKWAKNAPVLMLSIAKLNFEESGEPNRHAFHDVGLAVANLIIQAEHLKLHTHQMAGIDIEKTIKTFDIPNTHQPVAAIAIGYYGESEELPENLKERELSERVRKPLDEIVTYV
jgi:nitroreductase